MKKRIKTSRQVEQYIAHNLPNLKIKAARIVMGSFLVTTLSLYPMKTAADAENELRPPNSDLIYVGQSLRTQALTLPNGVYRRGDRGKEVRMIQEALASLGYRLQVDGIYGPQTSGIILHFQKIYPELEADGIYGSRTKVYLKKLLFTPFRIISNPNNRLVLVNKLNSLPHDYVPNDLVVPNVPFTFEEFMPKKLMRKEAAQALEELFKKAKQDHVSLLGVSGYRSYERQADIFARNAQKSGNANQWSARPGESEHQTGLAMDVTSPTVNYQLTQSFGNTQEGQWLKKNAPEFGFIIRYPKGKETVTGYQYEPWHLRYVGKDVAKQIVQQNLTLEYLR